MKVTKDPEIMKALQKANFDVEGASIEIEGPHPVRVRLVVYFPTSSREVELAFALEDGEIERIGGAR